jgi:transposase
MRTIGIDLAIRQDHKAIVADEQGKFITPVLTFATRAGALDWLLARAREGAPGCPLQVVLEPTGMAWFPLAAYLARQENVTVYLVTSQQVADLRRFYKRHAKSDRVDARVLAKLAVVNPEKLHPLRLPPAGTLACQRGCKQLDRLGSYIIAIQNRLQAMDRFAWPGLDRQLLGEPFGPLARWFRAHCYDPRQVLQAGADTLRAQCAAQGLEPPDAGAWADALVALAAGVQALYGAESPCLDFGLLQAEADREQEVLALLEQLQHTLRLKTVRPLYRALHPSRNLETIQGVGQDGAAVFASFIGEAARFDSHRLFRGWHGMVPDSRQSADSESKGLHITQAGPDLVKKYAYLDADVARQWDPQLAAIYYDQMVHKGKHHNQALCTCAPHLLDRVLTVWREDRPYEVRDVDGTPVTWEEARHIIATRYTVPPEVRQRNSKRARQERRDRRAERREKKGRESRPSR